MSDLIVSLLSGAAGALITYRVMKVMGRKVDQAKLPLISECAGLHKQNRGLESVITERRVRDAYQAGYGAREEETAAMERELHTLREQIRLEATLDKRAGDPGNYPGNAGKVVNIFRREG